MFSEERFKALVQVMVEEYGVRSYLDNIEDDMTEDEIDSDLWFECPECGEPILYEDFAEEMESLISGEVFTCPICEEELEF